MGLSLFITLPALSTQINGEIIAGYSNDKASKCIKKAAANNIKLAVRDRPFERTITMQKDSTNHVGFSYNNGEIKAIVKDSSAARCVREGVCLNVWKREEGRAGRGREWERWEERRSIDMHVYFT